MYFHNKLILSHKCEYYLLQTWSNIKHSSWHTTQSYQASAAAPSRFFLTSRNLETTAASNQSGDFITGQLESFSSLKLLIRENEFNL